MTEKQIPSYIKIKETLSKEIKTGNWPPGSRILTERELAKKFSVSRMTARQAIKALEQEGLLVCKQGSGTYVALNKISHVLTDITSFTTTLRAKGVNPEAVTLYTSVNPAGPKLAAILKINPDDLVIKIDQLHLANGTPIAILKLRVVHSLCPGLSSEDIVTEDYYDVIEKKYGVVFISVDHHFGAVVADREMAGLLRVKAGFPLLKVERIAYTTKNKPVNYSLIFFRGDQYSYKTTLHRNRFS